MFNDKWERRDAKLNSKKRFSSDNRNSIRLIESLSLTPDKLKHPKNRTRIK